MRIPRSGANASCAKAGKLIDNTLAVMMLEVNMLAIDMIAIDNLKKTCRRHRRNNVCIYVFLVIIFFTRLATCQLFDKI